MTGPEHYAEAERLLAVADRHTSGVTYGPEWTLTLTAAHVHATLALVAATAIGTAGPDRTAWADIAATKHGSKPQPRAPILLALDPNSGVLRRSTRQKTGRATSSSRDPPLEHEVWPARCPQNCQAAKANGRQPQVIARRNCTDQALPI
jgi:hypothetical protein